MAEGGQKRDPSSHRTPGQITRQVKGYNATPKATEKRGKNNKARKELGLKVGDPRDADHIKPLRSGGSNAKSNLRAVHQSKNRAWRSEGKAATKKGQEYRRPGERKK